MAKIPRVKPTTIYTGIGMPSMSGYKKSSTKRSRYRSKQALTNESDPNGRLFCAALASSIIAEDDGSVCADLCSDEGSYNPCDDDYEIVEVPYNYQYSLNLETIEDREEELQRMIRKTENLYESLGMYALRWHYLMQDVENNPGIESMFDNLQLLRKLSGGTVF